MIVKTSYSFQITSHLAAPFEKVWHQVNTLGGVNEELMPLLRMTAPNGKAHLSFAQAPLHRPIFASWLLLFGLLPFDLHQLQLDEVWNGGFRENSTSLVHRAWRHERMIVTTDTGCSLTDALEFEPRLPLVGYVLLPIVRYVFQHRHRRLKWIFGGESG